MFRPFRAFRPQRQTRPQFPLQAMDVGYMAMGICEEEKKKLHVY